MQWHNVILCSYCDGDIVVTSHVFADVWLKLFIAVSRMNKDYVDSLPFWNGSIEATAGAHVYLRSSAPSDETAVIRAHIDRPSPASLDR